MADVAIFAVLWGLGWLLLFRVPVPGPAPAGRGVPLSIVIPARDEEGVLPDLLASLRPEVRPGDEVVVVDDHSTDATAAVAAAGGATVLAAPPLPAGWTGKSWACHVGAARAANETLVFLDADTRCLTGGLARLAALSADRGGLVSVQPFHLVPRPVERLAAFFNVVGMMGTGAFSVIAPVGGRGAHRGAFGPCLLTSVEDYRRAGGHAAVREAVLEDVALAGRYHRAGLGVHLFGGRGTITFRMYASGLGALVEGFTKNVAGGALAVGPARALPVAGWLAACTAPAAIAPRLPAVALACYALVAVQLHVHLRRLGTFGPLTAALYAVPLALFLVVFARSLLLTATRRGVMWKGRVVPSRPSSGGKPPPGSTGAPPRSP